MARTKFLTTWASGTNYAVGDIVDQSGYKIQCVTQHVAGTFNTDVKSGYWRQIVSTKNYIINGDMRIAQRGSSFTNPTGIYTLDRHLLGFTTALGNVTQDTDVPTQAQAGYSHQNSWKVAITTPDTSIAVGDQYILSQRIEGYNWSSIAGKPMNMSFWIKAPVTGIYSMSMGNNGGGADYVTEFTINNANTWEFKTANISAAPLGNSGWTYASGIGLIARIAFAGGSNFFPTQGNDLWGTNNRAVSANQVNGVGVSGNILVTGWMLNEGVAPAPFETFSKNNYQGDLAECQRYYCFVGSGITWGDGYSNATGGYVVNASGMWPVVMRNTPNLNSPTWNLGTNNAPSASATINGFLFSSISNNTGTRMILQLLSTLTADAEL